MTKVVFLLVPGLHLLDLAGPAQAFGTAADLGYQVTFVTEATATSPIAHRDAPDGLTAGQLLADPRTLPASAVIERTEYALAGRFATIATIAAACGQVTLTRS